MLVKKIKRSFEIKENKGYKFIYLENTRVNNIRTSTSECRQDSAGLICSKVFPGMIVAIGFLVELMY